MNELSEMLGILQKTIAEHKMSTTITSKPIKHTLSILIDNQLTVIRTYNYTSNYIGRHGYASDHQMPSGKPSCFFMSLASSSVI